jgi:hypothetical protein
MSAATSSRNSAMLSKGAFERRIIRERLQMRRSPARYIVLKAGKRMNTLLLDSLYPAGQKAAAQNQARHITATEKRDTLVAVVIDHNIAENTNGTIENQVSEVRRASRKS